MRPTGRVEIISATFLPERLPGTFLRKDFWLWIGGGVQRLRAPGQSATKRGRNHHPTSIASIPCHFSHPRPLQPCLQSPRFRRRSVSRDVRGQAEAGALIGTVTCGNGEGGESHGRCAERQISLSSLPLAARPGSVEPCKWPERATQRGEAIICRGRKPRENAEGHANAEPLN